jgi:hypothetical protein
VEGEKKNIFLWVYYLGLVLGIFWMNYACDSRLDFVEELMEQFGSLDKFSLIIKEEYFFYLLFLRGKQFLFLLLCYLFFPKRVLLLFLDGYVSFFLGSFLSVEAYFQGIKGILTGACSFFPHFLCYGMIYFLAVCYQDSMRKKQYNQGKKSLMLAILFFFAGCVLETYVNPFFMMVLYGKN